MCSSAIRRCAACCFATASAGICPGIGKVGTWVSQGNFPLHPQSDPAPSCFVWGTGYFSKIFFVFIVLLLTPSFILQIAGVGLYTKYFVVVLYCVGLEFVSWQKEIK